MRTLARPTVAGLTRDAQRILAAIAQQTVVLTAINERLARLEQTRAPRDASDRHLLTTIAASVLGTRFSAGECFRHARHAPELREALESADIDNSIQLGLLLRRMSGCSVDGCRLEPLDEIDRDGGRVWHFVRESQR